MYKLLQRIPEFRGKKRIAKFLLRNFIARERKFLINCKGDLQYLVPNFIENIGFDILVNGIYEPETQHFILSRLPNHSTLLDIGANIGSITIPIAKRRRDVKVISIEASTDIYTYLQENLRLNKIENCIALNNAISDKNGEEVQFFSPDDKFGKGSLAPVFTNRGKPVKTITIDNLFETFSSENIQFIKIDIEGFEYVAFAGGSEVLQKEEAPDILFEFVDWAETNTGFLQPGDAQAILLKYGYKLYLLTKEKKGSKMEQLHKPLEMGHAMLYATKKDV